MIALRDRKPVVVVNSEGRTIVDTNALLRDPAVRRFLDNVNAGVRAMPEDCRPVTIQVIEESK